MADISKIKLPSNTIYDVKDTVARNGLNGKQNTLVSGTNIKTINNQSLLGSGNIPISSDGNYFIDIDNWTSQNYVELEDAIRTGKYLYIGQEDEQSGEIFHSPVTCSGITEDSEIICYYIEDDTVHMYTFHSDGTYYYEYHYLQRKLTAGSGIEINSSNVISATGTATSSTDGLMSSTDKQKLDTIPISEGTLTDNLTVGDSFYINKVVDIDSTVAPSSDKWKTAIHIKDKNDLSLGYLEGAILSNGNNGLTLTARRDISGTSHYNGVRLLIDNSGNPVTQFNSSAAWRKGLGLSLSSVQNIASYITSTKGTFVSGSIITYDRIAQLIIRVRNTSTIGAGGNIYEGKLTKWHPVSQSGTGVNGIGYFSSNALVGYINAGGDIIVRNASSNSITVGSSASVTMTFTYLMGANQ